MKVLTIVAGVNGTGKSSFLGVLKEQMDSICSFFDIDSNPSFLLIQQVITAGNNFVIETSALDSFVIDVVKTASESGYHILLYYIGLDNVQDSLDRIANRVKRGGQGIPADEVLSQFENRWSSLSELLPYCSESIFYDNYNGFIEVGEYRNGELVLIGDYRPHWVMELKGFWK